jgi:hypothetical protein
MINKSPLKLTPHRRVVLGTGFDPPELVLAGSYRQPVAPASKPVDDLLDIFGDAPVAPGQAPSCGMQAEREKDFWDSVTWKHETFVFLLSQEL